MRHATSALGSASRQLTIGRVMAAFGHAMPAVLALAALGTASYAQSLAPTGYWQYTGTGTVTAASLTSSGTNTTSVMTVPGTAPVYTPNGMLGSAVEMAYASFPTTQAGVEYLRLNIGFGAATAPTGGYALGNSFTIGSWYYVTNVNTSGRTFLWEGANDFDLSLGNGSSGNTTATAYNSTAQTLTVPNALTTGTWRHVMQVYSSVSGTTQMTVYLDGETVGTTAGVASSTISDTAIHLATARAANVRPLYGLMDETAVWSRAISAAEALNAYNRGLAGAALTNAGTVTGYTATATGNAWLTGANWAGGVAPGTTGNAASTDGTIAVVGNYAFTDGLGIDMGAAGGNVALGAIAFNSLAGSGNLLVGNASASSGTLTLNGAQLDGSSNVILNNEGGSDLTIANVQGTDSGQRLTLQLGATANVVRAAAGRTLTIAADIAERAAGSGLSVDGGGLVVLSGSNTYSGGTTLSAGSLTVGNAAGLGAAAGAVTVTGGTLDLGGFTIPRSGSVTLAGGAIQNGTFTTSSSIYDVRSGAVSAVLGGAAGLTKSTTGTVTLSTANTYAGATSITDGRLNLTGGDNRLPTATALTISGGSLDVGSGTQTVTNFSATSGTVLGSGTLAVSAATGGVRNVTLTNLGRFSYDAVTGTVNIGGQATGQSGVVTLSGSTNFVRAGTIRLPVEQASTGGTTGTLTLGGENTLHVNTLDIGRGTQTTGTAQFAAGLSSPTLTIRSQTGTGRTAITIGYQNNNTFSSSTGTLNTEAGTLDALVSTLLLGRGHTTNTGRGTGNFYMGSGTLDATTITLGNSHVQPATGNLRVTGGTVIVSTLNMGLQSSTATPTSSFTLQGDGTLAATTVNVAAAGSNAFIWNAGTIRNRAGGDLTINGGFTTFDVATAGSHVFEIEAGRTGTVSQGMSGTGGITKTGAGLLTLAGSSGFSGGLTISAGTLVAANSAALGSGTATVAAGARLRLGPGSIIANPIAALGTGSFLGSLDFAGGGIMRASTAGGTTQGTLLAGSSATSATLNPAIAWLTQTSDTASDIMQLTNTAGTAQVLSLTYAPGVTPATPQDAYLGWFDAGTTNSWVNAVAGNSGGAAGFFQGSWLDYVAANPGATPTSALGTYGHDSTTRTVWAAVNHNSDFAVIVVPEPGTLALAGFGLATLAALLHRRRPSGALD